MAQASARAARAAIVSPTLPRGAAKPRGAFAGDSDFGTINGAHSLAEVRELLKAKDYEHGQMQAAADKIGAVGIAAKDPTWAADWKAFLDRYKKARDAAMTTGILGSPDGPLAGVTPAEGTWQMILNTLTRDPSKPYTDQDEQGLFNRLTKAGAAPDVSKVPQPATKDIDLGIYQKADDLTKQIDKVVPPSPAKNPWPWVIGGAAVLGLGYVALQVSPAGVAMRAFKRR